MGSLKASWIKQGGVVFPILQSWWIFVLIRDLQRYEKHERRPHYYRLARRVQSGGHVLLASSFSCNLQTSQERETRFVLEFYIYFPIGGRLCNPNVEIVIDDRKWSEIDVAGNSLTSVYIRPTRNEYERTSVYSKTNDIFLKPMSLMSSMEVWIN